MMSYRVPFRISGTVEVDADSVEDAWERVQDMSKRELIDDAVSVSVDFERPEEM